ncbi:protein slit-like [Liolophura sinensis]|uniref:protein slit-like n=1 Tax=Liolophura sinensis TaxID=3198878 RepID=UPI003159198B
MLLVLLFVLVMYSEGFVSNQDECATSTSVCACKGADIICSNARLSTVPTFRSTFREYNRLFLDGNRISSIKKGDFANLVTGRELFIALNGSSTTITFEPGGFSALANVNVNLYLGDNPTDVNFGQALQGVNITELTVNDAKALDGGTMFTLGDTLEKFSVGIGRLSEWPEQLRFLRRLKYLMVSNEKLITIPDTAFHGFEHSLLNLTFSDTGLLRFPDAVCHLTRLQALEMSHHRGSAHYSPVPYCQQPMSGVKNLTLHDVGLSRFPEIFHTFSGLLYVQVSGNPDLKFIADDSLPRNTTVKTLNLAGNGFKQVPSSLRSLLKLLHLDLSNNEISTLERGDLDSLPHILSLRLAGNPIVYVYDFVFASASYLNQLDLSNTSLTNIPKAVTHLSSATQILDLSNNNIECTCDLQWILKWSGSAFIFGNCRFSTESFKQFISNQLTECEIGI